MSLKQKKELNLLGTPILEKKNNKWKITDVEKL
jgi:hypothetical protein